MPCRDQRERWLWSAVVDRAAEDLAAEPLGSPISDEAVAFFIGAGAWAKSRADVADRIDVHADDLERYGRRLLVQKRRAEGLPTEPVMVRCTPPQAPVQHPPLPCSVANPAPSIESQRGRPAHRVNPFNPFFRRSSGVTLPTVEPL